MSIVSAVCIMWDELLYHSLDLLGAIEISVESFIIADVLHAGHAVRL